MHNNYLTLPVLFSMLAGHFPFTYGHAHSWAILVCLMVIGAWIRHYFNLRHAGRTLWWIPLTAAAGIAAIAVWIRPSSAPASTSPAGVSFAQVQPILAQRCAFCLWGSLPAKRSSRQPDLESLNSRPTFVKKMGAISGTLRQRRKSRR